MFTTGSKRSSWETLSGRTFPYGMLEYDNGEFVCPESQPVCFSCDIACIQDLSWIEGCFCVTRMVTRFLAWCWRTNPLLMVQCWLRGSVQIKGVSSICSCTISFRSLRTHSMQVTQGKMPAVVFFWQAHLSSVGLSVLCTCDLIYGCMCQLALKILNLATKSSG